MDLCPICNSPCTIAGTYETLQIDCLRCGRFAIGELTSIVLKQIPLTLKEIANASGWIREHQGVLIGTTHDPFLRSLRPPPVGDKATKLMLALSTLHPSAGIHFPVWSCDLTVLDANNHLPARDRSTILKQYLYIVGSAWIEGKQEFDYLIWDYLRDSRKLIAEAANTSSSLQMAGGFHNCKITPDGWAFLHELQRSSPTSHVCFIAMWFREELDPLLLAIESGVRASGYDPKRIDRVQHNNRIDDEIITWIRRSKFVVADMTGNRGGVYFESGYALGMGLQVIWLCRKGRLSRVHFDNRQYNFIEWSFDQLSDLTRRLQNRIEATIGKPA